MSSSAEMDTDPREKALFPSFTPHAANAQQLVLQLRTKYRMQESLTVELKSQSRSGVSRWHLGDFLGNSNQGCISTRGCPPPLPRVTSHVGLACSHACTLFLFPARLHHSPFLRLAAARNAATTTARTHTHEHCPLAGHTRRAGVVT